MRSTRQQQEDALTAYARTAAYRRAADELDHVAVCLIGYAEPVPYRLGSNDVRQPVRVVVTRDPASAAKRPDAEQPLHELVVLDYVWTDSDAHARRLKAALDAALIGEDPDLTKLRHAWRDCPEPGIAWSVLLGEALRSIRAGGEQIEVFGEDTRRWRIAAHARRRVRGNV